MNKIIALLIFLTFWLAGLPCEAATEEGAVSARVTAVLGMKPAYVTKKPFGLWEVVLSPNRIIYVDDQVRHAFAGRVINLETMTDLTQARIEELSRIDWASLPLRDAIKVVHGSGKHEVAVFADAACIYCRRLESYFSKISDVTVYTFIFSMKNSRNLSRGIVCSRNAPQAWTDLMIKGKQPVAGECDDSLLDRNDALSKKLGVTGTPTIFFPSGERLGGVPSFEDLQAFVKAGGIQGSAKQF